MREMRRKDRQVTDFEKIKEIIAECDVIRLGFQDGDFPYIVPLNFGYEIDGDQIYFYIHGALAGRKYDLIKEKGVCSFEMDKTLMLDLVPEAKDVTTRYKSLFGHAKIDILEGDDKWHGIKVIMDRDERTRDFEYNKDVVPRTLIAKLTVLEYTGKINPIGGNAD